LIVISLVKTLGIPMYILNLLNLENIEGLEVIILGLAGLVSRLGFKDLVEEIFIGNYATMGGEDPTQESSPDSKTGGVGATDISDGDISKKDGQSSSDGNRQPKSGSSAYIDAQTGAEPLSKVDTQKQESSSKNSSPINYTAPMKRKAFDNLLGSLVEEVKGLTISMNNANNDEEWNKLRDRVDGTLDAIELVSEASAEEVKKEMASQERGLPSKRDIDAVEKAKNEGEPSKKK